ncbi:MAG: ArnT family glycosyltransferase [Candidatus Hodarchaeota archaeon]
MKKEGLDKYLQFFRDYFDHSAVISYLSRVKFPLLLIFLGIFLRLFNPHSITMWDEGWFTDIAARMLTAGGDPILPLYKEFGVIKLFDKPPFIFWCGALAMSIFGFTSLAAKLPMGVMGGLLGVCAYYLLSKSDENQAVAVIAGLLTTCTWFVVFYSRTAYIDVTIVFLSSLVILFAVRGADELFAEEPNTKLAYVYLLLCAIANVVNLLAKAWQGLIPGVAVGVYFFVKYLAKKIPEVDIRRFWYQLNFNEILPVSLIGGVASFGLISLLFLFAVPGATLVLAVYCIVFFTYVLSGLFSWVRISDQKDYYIITGVTSLASGLAGSLASIFGVRILSGTYGKVISQLLEAVSLQDFALMVEQIILGLVASFIGLIVCSLICIFILGISLRHKPILILIRDSIKLLPVFLIGGWVGFWGYFIFLKGEFFARDPVLTILVGAIGALVVLAVSCTLNWFLEGQFNLLLKQGRSKPFNSVPELVKDVISSSPYTIYIGLAVFFIILTFFPILNWIKYMDTNYVIPGIYELRRPGELLNPPPEFNYEWLFFDYYLGWRYENPSPNVGYTMWAAVSSAFMDPLFIAVAPFFVVGIYAFYKTRHYAQGVLFLSWFGIVMTAFMPAEFQLNYYYLAAFLPYLCVAGKGVAYVFKDPGHFFTRDLLERLLIATPYSLVMFSLFILEPFSVWGSVPFLNLVFFAIMEGGYLLLVWRVNESIPGILTLGVCFYSFYRCFYLYGPADHDLIYLLIAGMAIAVSLYWLKGKVRFSGLFLLAMVLLSTVTCLSWLVYANDTYGAELEDISLWILSHGGDYDFSTRVFPDPGVKYAMRYYLNHTIVPGRTAGGQWLADNLRWNSSTAFAAWIRGAPYVRFWVVTNGTFGETKPDSDYSESYLWLKENFQCYDEEVGIPPFHTVHLFANLTGLENSKTMAPKGSTDIHSQMMDFTVWNQYINTNINEGIISASFKKK